MNILQYHFYGKTTKVLQEKEKELLDIVDAQQQDIDEYKTANKILNEELSQVKEKYVNYQTQADVYYKEINQLKIDKMALQTKLDQLTFALMHIAGKVHSNQWSSAKKQIHKIFIKEDIEVQQHVINTMFGCNHSQEAILRQIRRVEKGSK